MGEQFTSRYDSLALVFQHGSHRVVAVAYVFMFRPEGLDLDLKPFLVRLQGQGVLSLAVQHGGDVAVAGCDVLVVRPCTTLFHYFIML